MGLPKRVGRGTKDPAWRGCATPEGARATGGKGNHLLSGAAQAALCQLLFLSQVKTVPLKADWYIQSDQKGNFQNISFLRGGSRRKPSSLRHRRGELRLGALFSVLTPQGQSQGAAQRGSSVAGHRAGLSGPADPLNIWGTALLPLSALDSWLSTLTQLSSTPVWSGRSLI